MGRNIMRRIKLVMSCRSLGGRSSAGTSSVLRAIRSARCKGEKNNKFVKSPLCNHDCVL